MDINETVDTTLQTGSTPGSENANPIITVDNGPATPIDGVPGALNLMEQEYKLPSGSIAKIERFSGLHVIEALTASDKKKERTEDGMLWELIAATCCIDGARLTPGDIDEMDGRDLDFLMGKFSTAIEGKEMALELPTDIIEPPKESRWKRLPDDTYALIEKYKGRHVKEAQRQMSPDGSNYLTVLMSRMIKLGKTPDTVKGIFPEDLYSIDGLAFLSLLGEVAEAMFPTPGAS